MITDGNPNVAPRVEAQAALIEWQPYYWHKLPLQERDRIDREAVADFENRFKPGGHFDFFKSRYGNEARALDAVYEISRNARWGALIAAWDARKAAVAYDGQTKQRRKNAPRCGARRKNGEACKASIVRGRNRCKFHGGLNTGPKSIEGKLKALANLTQFRNAPAKLDAKRRELEAAE